jgi:hypothetical protein
MIKSTLKIHRFHTRASFVCYEVRHFSTCIFAAFQANCKACKYLRFSISSNAGDIIDVILIPDSHCNSRHSEEAGSSKIRDDAPKLLDGDIGEGNPSPSSNNTVKAVDGTPAGR